MDVDRKSMLAGLNGPHRIAAAKRGLGRPDPRKIDITNGNLVRLYREVAG